MNVPVLGWFIVPVSIVVGAAVLMTYRLRVRQLTRAYSVRHEERWAERTRIAREVHDTLLQNFQGLMFRFQAVRELLPVQPDEAIAVLETALLKGEEAIDQARSAVSDVTHRSESETGPCWKLDMRGRMRDISSTALYELYPVVREAICNAIRHARAASVTIEVRYGIESLHITVADDGVGFDEVLLSSERRPGHFGLQGMMERIARLGGEMALRSRPHEGTRVMLSVPGAVAYCKVSSTPRTDTLPWWSGRWKADSHD